jgi:hypothetical protein
MGRIINLLNDLTNCFDVINDQTFLFISDSDLYPYTLQLMLILYRLLMMIVLI